MDVNLPTIAGFISTALFAVGTVPMLAKALRTRNLASYSLGNILLSNVGNLIYALYVFQLPPGPVWLLHGYNLVSTGLMLVWYLKYEVWPHRLQSEVNP
jgi:Na+-driven multidrug efflux pump